jgi:peroxiredoxin
MKRLPTVSLKTPDGMTVTTDWRKHAVTVIVMLHDGNCHACRATCQRYVAERAAFGEWDAELLLVWRGERVPEGCEGMLDASGAARRAWLESDAAGVLLVDRNGVVVRRWNASGKGFPSPEEVLAAVKHVALQCPE